MGSRPGPVEIMWQHGAEAFAFLTEEWDFTGPELTDAGIAFHRPDLHVDVEIWAWKNEAGFTTGVRRVDPATGEQQAAGLDRLYVECGLGPPQHVPENLGGGHTIVKRLTQHARALQLLMPYLTGPAAAALFHRCRSGPR
ncbi:hypothetical protein [Micromonospora sp. MA102]|uniref:hypothetical protein n=1 Tax=Micromonospora sp. MA102 TaxID=2952755 RepID=UPI0021C79670|nr:hypothetical protein [Micromonospora sp. MA102]